MTIRSGCVYLLGAGPGDPGLITVRALEVLERADVVIHDRLIGAPLLERTRADAEVIDAGKAPGAHGLTQEWIEALLVDRARAGCAVARLKGGDPFVFGRGWEELEACRRAEIPCEVVPGVSSAIAGPGAGEIPVTARGVARSFGVVTGRTGRAADDLDHLDFGALARLDTVVFLMGVGALTTIVDALVRAGRGTSTPVAIVERATLPGQREVRATLGTIVGAAREAGVGSPAVIVVGDVAALGAGSVTERPLAGRRVLVTRPRTASHGLTQRLRSLGATAIDCPLIRIVHREPESDAWADRLADYHWIVLTSRHGARAFFRALRAAKFDARALAGARIAGVGPTTAREIEACGLTADLIPDEFRAGPLAKAILDHPYTRANVPARVLFPCGTLARDELTTRLREAGVVVDPLVVYDTLLESPDERARAEIARGLDAVLLASPSAARALGESGTRVNPKALTVCIGPTTAGAARRAGLPNVVAADEHSDAGLVRSLLDSLAPAETAA